MNLLPPNKYIVIDPCYVLTDEVYDKMIDQSIISSQPQLIDLNGDGKPMMVCSTLYGDGYYESNLGVYFPVDSGQIAVIPLELCDSDALNDAWNQQHSFLIEGEINFDYDTLDGTITVNHLEIYTGGLDSDEE
ncbi:hypothetical protein ACX818_001424 [Acinetobacter baumannii]